MRYFLQEFNSRTAITGTNDGQLLSCHVALLGHNEFIRFVIWRCSNMSNLFLFDLLCAFRLMRQRLFKKYLEKPLPEPNHYLNLRITVTLHQHHGASSHHNLRCLINNLFRITTNKSPKLRVTGPLCGIHRCPVDSPKNNVESVPMTWGMKTTETAKRKWWEWWWLS